MAYYYLKFHFIFASPKVKNETMRISKWVAEPNKIKRTDAMLAKMAASVEEVRKAAASDAKTLSSMNTMLQGMRASSTATEGKISANIKEVSCYDL